MWELIERGLIEFEIFAGAVFDVMELLLGFEFCLVSLWNLGCVRWISNYMMIYGN